jgi:hypothetical protein
MDSATGRAAGKVWVVLGEKGELEAGGLPGILKMSAFTAYQAVGWLAREGKIRQMEKDGKIFISLTEKELEVFSSLF